MALSLHYLKRVLYTCSCSQPSPLTDLYFCRHCKVPRCQDCVSISTDIYFCPHCFEAAVHTEAHNRKNRCNHCFQCPRCSSTLTTRSIIVPSEVLGEQSPKKPESPSPRSLSRSPGGTKTYYLSCTHCKWSTRDVGIKDKRSPIDFKDPPFPNQERVTRLLSFYKEFSLRDQAEREKAKKIGRRTRSFGGLLDTSKFTKSGSSDSPTLSKRHSIQGPWDRSIIEKMAAQSTDCPEPVPESFYTEEPDLRKIATMKQQLLDPAHLPERVDQFTPRPLHLISKRLSRCKGCEHILLKAELGPTSIRFKIKQIALHTFPQVRIFEPPKLVAGEPSEVLLSVSNPVNHIVGVWFEQLDQASKEKMKFTLSEITLPDGKYQLSPNEDMGDLLDEEGKEELEGDNHFIHSRLLGKLILKFKVTPHQQQQTEDAAAGGNEIKCGFQLGFQYKSTMDTEGLTCDVSLPVVVDLGKSLLLID